MSISEHKWRDALALVAPPLALMIILLAALELAARLHGEQPGAALQAPSVVWREFVENQELFLASALATLSTTLQALILATLGGVALALAMAQSKWLSRTLGPYAISLQVTPVVAIAPLLLIYLSPAQAVLGLAFLAAFFPILTNTALGLASVDHALLDLFDLYGASAWRRLVYLRAPAASPQFFAGLRIAGGLALVGAVVAELAAGQYGAGLASRIFEAGFRLNIPRIYVSLALLALMGNAIYGALSLLGYLALRRWHESARKRGE